VKLEIQNLNKMIDNLYRVTNPPEENKGGMALALLKTVLFFARIGTAINDQGKA
jgi:hypothetical protein